MKMLLIKLIVLVVLFRVMYKYRYVLLNALFSVNIIRQFFVSQSMKMPFPSGFIIQNLIS